MPRLPQIGGDDGNWGIILNDFLSQELSADGSLKIRTNGVLDAKVNTNDSRLSDARLTIKKDGTSIGARKNFNLIQGSGVTLTAADNAGTDTVDITVAATNSGSSVGGNLLYNSSTGWPARPSGVASVTWVGPSAPPSAISGDMWLDTSGS